MKELIYYPGFEVKDETWLKFALLYFNKLRPIIPDISFSRETYLSNTFLKIMDETDLIEPYRPSYNEGYCASLLACEEFEKYFCHPERYGRLFNRPYAKDLRSKWANRHYQTSTLFDGKYTSVFTSFCLDNKIATPCREGIQISEDLSFVYMAFLADIISKNNELEMITDSQRYTTVTLKNVQNLTASTRQSYRVAQNAIEFSIPSDLNHIPIEHFIQLRGQRSFNECRISYMRELDKMITCMESGQADYSMEKQLSCKKDLIKICEKSFNMIAAATLSAYSFVALSNEVQEASIMYTIAAAYMDYQAAKDVFSEIPEFVRGLKNKRLARKYVAKISQLNAHYRI